MSGILNTRKNNVSETGSVSVLGHGEGRHLNSWVPLKELTSYTGLDWRLAVSKGLERVHVSLPSPEDGNRSSFRNVVFSNI
jgi:hypothetical protein